MADYYSLLSRAVSNLPKASPASARRAIYDRARKALIGQLRSLKPALPESDIAREENALDAAVARLEAEFEPPPPPPPAPAPVVSVRPPPPPRPPVTPTRPAAPSKAPTLALRTAAASSPVAVSAVSAPSIASTPGNATAAQPVALVAPRSAPPSSIPAAALRPSFGLGAASLKTAAPEANAAAPPVSAATEPAGQDNAPRLGSPLEAPASRGEADPPRPVAPGGHPALGRNNPWPWIALAVVVGLVGSIAVAAFLFRERPQDLTIKDPAEAPASASSPPSGQKIVERVGGANASPPADTPSPPPATAVAPAPVSPAATANPATAAAPSVAAPAVAAMLPVSARAAMLVATAADVQKPVVTVGTVVWSPVSALPGQPGSVGVKAEVDIPDLKMHASMTLRKNMDAALPASHTIDLRLIFDEGSPIKGVKDIDLPRMRRDDSPNADPLLGVKVKINDSYFLIGLNRADADVSRNIDEISSRGWFDFPLLLNDDRIAKLTFEKAIDGERIINDALTAWK